MACQVALTPVADLLPALELAVPLVAPWLMALATWRFLAAGGRSRKALLRLVAAQLLGAWGLAWPFLVWACGQVPNWGEDPLRAFPLHALLLGLVAGLLWFAVGFGLGGIPAADRRRAALVQASLLLMLGLGLALASRWSLAVGLRWVSPQALEPGLTLLYLDDGIVRKWEGPGSGTQILTGIPRDPEMRLSARPAASGWTLLLQGRRETRVLAEGFAPSTARFALQPEVAFRPQGLPRDPAGEPQRLAARPLPVSGAEAFGGVPSLDPTPAWQVRFGQWPREGLQARAQDPGSHLDLALDTPFWSPAPRCGTLLPGNRMVLQVGSCLYLVHLERREIACLGRGQGPLAGLF